MSVLVAGYDRKEKNKQKNIIVSLAIRKGIKIRKISRIFSLSKSMKWYILKLYKCFIFFIWIIIQFLYLLLDSISLTFIFINIRIFFLPKLGFYRFILIWLRKKQLYAIIIILQKILKKGNLFWSIYNVKYLL